MVWTTIAEDDSISGSPWRSGREFQAVDFVFHNSCVFQLIEGHRPFVRATAREWREFLADYRKTDFTGLRSANRIASRKRAVVRGFPTDGRQPFWHPKS